MLKYDSSSREVRLTVDRDYKEGMSLPYPLLTLCTCCCQALFGRYVLAVHASYRLFAMSHTVIKHALDHRDQCIRRHTQALLGRQASVVYTLHKPWVVNASGKSACC